MPDVDPSGLSFDSFLKAAGVGVLAVVSKYAIRVWKSTKKERYDAHHAIIVELRRINSEQWVRLNEQRSIIHDLQNRIAALTIENALMRMKYNGDEEK